MRFHKHLFLLLMLVSGGYTASAQAQAMRWSDPAAWPNNQVPAAGDKVAIASGKEVILDVSPPALSGLTINGKLTFADESDLALSTEWIMVFGELEIGTEDRPFTHKATITLTNDVQDEQLMGMGDRGIMLSGGTLNLHGNRTNTWTKLASTAEAGTRSIVVLDASQWQTGDEIVLASTDYDPRQAERRTITAISGNNITLDAPLEYMHFGKITFDVDERGEVGLLTRNIKIQGSEDAAQSYFGGHIMAMVTSKMYVEGVELNRMGQHLELARYPIHWHLVGDGGKGQYIKNAAIHDTFNRCVTVHGSNDIRVENNVTYNTVGHCFFMEDGIEHGNEFIHNLAIQTKCHMTMACVPTNLAAAGELDNYDDRQAVRQSGQNATNVLLPSDNTVASFWITNPDNTYIDNVAAGSDSNGFWMSLPEHPNGAFDGSDESMATWPRNMRMREFKGNVAHSNYDGFMFDRNINTDNTFGVTGNMHIARANPADRSSAIVETEFEDLTAYKNSNGGFWGRGEMRTIRNYKSADNAIGYTQASGLAGGASLEDPYTSRVIDSLFVGDSENIGNPRTSEELAYGRSLPKPMMPDFPIRGYEYYDNRHDVMDSTFVNFEDNATRKTGALSYLLFTSFGVSSNNAVEGLTFKNAKPVYFPPMAGNSRWANDNGNSSAYKTAVIRDKDGSLGVGPDTYVLIHEGENTSIATDPEACQIKNDWNAAVCTGDVGRLSFSRPFRFRAAPPRPTADSDDAPPRPRGGLFGAPQPPVTLSRSDQDHVIAAGGSNVRAETEITVTTEREELFLRLSELDQDSWVIFELPEFTTADAGVQQTSLVALRNASETSWFKDSDALWVKMVSPDSGPLGLGGETSLQVSR